MEQRIKIKNASEAAQKIIEWGEAEGLVTCFERAEKMKPCPIGETGACCKVCHMGPCRLVGPKAEEEATGVCGAQLSTIAARNLLRMVAAGTAAHSDHARSMALTLLAVGEGKTSDFEIKDPAKLMRMAEILEIDSSGKEIKDLAREVALKLLEDFSRRDGAVGYARRAPAKTQERWRKWGIVPRSIDREVVEAMHRTNMGVDHDPDHLLLHALKTSLADGWSGSMMATDITDVLFGTPKPVRAESSFGIFKPDHVNLVIHGHEPTLAEAIIDVVAEPELVEYAKSKGAKGINLGGMCCTANEVLMRHGIPTSGGFTNQELGVMTGLVDAIAVDVQCIMPAIVEMAKKFHTKVITTSEKAMTQGATHVAFDEHHAREAARKIARIAIDNFPMRTKKGKFVESDKAPVIAGFSHEYIEYMQGGRWRASFRPLNDAIMAGRIRGVVALVGCDNPRVPATGLFRYLAVEFIKQDVLVVTTGCGANAYAAAGFLTPETALEHAGPGLREVCEAIGIPPILHLGACVDNSRILTIASAMAAEGGLSDEIGGMPAVGIAPEWMSEKAIAIACYFAASGVPVIFGGGSSPVGASKEVTNLMTNVWYERFLGALHFEKDPEQVLALSLEYIDKARVNLKLKKYEPGRFGTERVLMDMAARRELERAAKPHLGVG
ncbi:MAG: anaerobic carbon-monoxide dehydrogenase catalytic subunit [Nitrospiraceae bacterium]|nr:anaerobic carbon-monoxide dehydrogenase catalytic subunit [Nitrospiraceae bacterium]